MTIFIIDHSQVKHDPFPPFKIPTSKGKKKKKDSYLKWCGVHCLLTPEQWLEASRLRAKLLKIYRISLEGSNIPSTTKHIFHPSNSSLLSFFVLIKSLWSFCSSLFSKPSTYFWLCFPSYLTSISDPCSKENCPDHKALLYPLVPTEGLYQNDILIWIPLYS